ncbi:hypothetical protein F4821DRAFT_279829 [Hypoxylon rubiginosum]|uniref:Uncharacterized protein n=1 Tax=Hypoxylon rubiginosum TaxID=110542 RepID=A0ACC0CWM4_9PEZI|nr:hypothetical protein F4821DRAFT_279829 [Hypoxylon rubiginosum]
MSSFGSAFTAADAFLRARARMGASTAFEKFPREVVVEIVKHCDIPSIINLALTGPTFYNYVKGDEHYIAIQLIIAHVDVYFMPLAVAQYLAKGIHHQRASRGLEELLNPEPIMSFVDMIRPDMERYKRPFVEKYRPNHVTLTLKAAEEILSFHSCAAYHAHLLEVGAMNDLGGYSDQDEFRCANGEEMQRFMKALYIFQVSCHLFPAGVRTPDHRKGKPGPLESACAKFFRMFAPWEQQQVRCVQEMLQNRIYNVAYRFALANTEWLKKPSHDAFELFVVQKGLEAVKTYESKGPLDLYGAVMNFKRDLRESEKYRRHSWHSNNDLLWLKASPDGKRISLEVDHIFAEFQENESGPRDVWLLTLLEPVSDDPLLFPIPIIDPVEYSFKWSDSITLDGLYFWGRKKIDRYDLGTLPETENMKKVSSGLELSPEVFLYHHPGRDNGNWFIGTARDYSVDGHD